jgi:hypothetical protein
MQSQASARRAESGQVMKGQAICKDCGAGTLNNEFDTQFDFVDGQVVCNSCGGSHIDGELYFEDEAQS